MVSGRNGVSFPIGTAALWWAMGLEVGRGECMCIYIWACQSAFEIWVVFTVMWVEGAGPTLSHEQRADCAADWAG